MIVVISNASRELLDAQSKSGRCRGGAQQADGRWRIELDDDVLEALGRLDPDIDKAIEMACTKQFGRA